jgi:hypothetical protein
MNPQKYPRTNGFYITLLILCCLTFASAFAGYSVTGSHMRLSGDDYCYDGILRRSGFWETQWNSYFHETTYSGNRYALTLFASFLGTFGPKANAVAPGFFLLIWIVSTFWLIKKLQDQDKKTWVFETLLAAFIVLFFTLSMSPSLEQSLYWRSAMLPYFLPIVGNTILAGIIMHEGQSKQPSFWGKFLILTLAILSGGFSETGAAFQLGYLLLWLTFDLSWKRGKTKTKRRLYPLIGLAILGTALSILLLVVSPTNALRQAQLNSPTPPSLPSLLQMSIKNAYLFIHSTVKWSFLPHFLIVLYFANDTWRKDSDTFSKSSHPLRMLITWTVLLPIVTFGLIMCIVAPSAWAQSSYPVARALIMGRLITVLASVLGGWILGRFMNYFFKDFSYKDSIQLGITILILISLTVFPILELRNVLSDLPRYQRWSTAWDERDQILSEAQSTGLTEVEVMEIDHIIPDVTELKPDPNFWYNNCAEWYYDLQSIRANQSGWDD